MPAYHAGAADALHKLGRLREAAAAQHAAMMRKRSQNLWRRVNPGCMEGYCGTPASTHSNNFQHVPGQIDPKTWDHHLQKTDFSHYVEEDAKQRRLEEVILKDNDLGDDYQWKWSDPFEVELKKEVKQYFEGEAKRRGVSFTQATKATPRR